MKAREGSVMVSSSLVQRIARQALVTFRQPPRAFPDEHQQLLGLMRQARAADLQLPPPPATATGSGSGSGSSPAVLGAPPVTYMHICETEHFSMGVFLLKSGARIPLHDHPGMHGVLKVLYGKLRVSCFDSLDRQAAPPRPSRPQVGAVRRSVLRSSAEHTDASEPCVLAPDRDNLHQIDAVDGPAAFLDVLAPPYDPDDGRDCHYFRVLQGPEPREPHEREVWLMEIAQPVSFWCGTAAYPGPEVRL